MTALNYAVRQDYVPGFVRLAQQTLGITPDPAGLWRCEDIEVIKGFQRAQKLTVDGLIGPTTASAIRAASGLLKNVPVEFWWDSGPIERVGTLARLGVSGLAIMLNRVSREHRFEPSWKYRDAALKQLTGAAIQRGMRLTGTVWVRPNKRQINAVCEYLDRVIPLGFGAVEVELEGNWKARNVWEEDFQDLESAASYLCAKLHALKVAHGVEIEATTFVGHGELSSARATVTGRPVIERLWPQVYSIYKPEPAYAWEASRRPGRFQEAEMARFASQWCGREVVCGLAGFAQSWPGRDPVDAMERAAVAAVLGGAKRLRYWSAKHFRTGGYLEEFLRRRRDGL